MYCISGKENEIEFVKYLNEKTISQLHPLFRDIINFNYKINTNITIGIGTKQEKVHIDKLHIILSLGL